MAQLKIAEGVEIIKHRQKFIRLADSSEAGWRAVDEYVKKNYSIGFRGREENQQSTDTSGEESQRDKGKETQGFEGVYKALPHNTVVNSDNIQGIYMEARSLLSM